MPIAFEIITVAKSKSQSEKRICKNIKLEKSKQALALELFHLINDTDSDLISMEKINSSLNQIKNIQSKHTVKRTIDIMKYCAHPWTICKTHENT